MHQTLDLGPLKHVFGHNTYRVSEQGKCLPRQKLVEMHSAHFKEPCPHPNGPAWGMEIDSRVSTSGQPLLAVWTTTAWSSQISLKRMFDH
jgi:hypothetical protein